MKYVLFAAFLYIVMGLWGPYSWSHRLTMACRWEDKPFWYMVAVRAPDDEDRRTQLACLRNRGQRDFGTEEFTVLKRWPPALVRPQR